MPFIEFKNRRLLKAILMFGNKMNKYLLYFCFVGVLILSPGCFGTYSIKPNFWNDKTATIGVAVKVIFDGDCEATLNKYNNISADPNFVAPLNFNEHIMSLVKPNILKIRGEFVEKLNNMGYKAKEITHFIEPNYINKGVMDLTPIALKENVDTLIVISVGHFGIINIYDKNGEITETKTAFEISGFMKKMKNGKMEAGFFRGSLWDAHLSYKENSILIGTGWNKPPDFPEVTKTLNILMENGRNYLIESFFKNTPIQK